MLRFERENSDPAPVYFSSFAGGLAVAAWPHSEKFDVDQSGFGLICINYGQKPNYAPAGAYVVRCNIGTSKCPINHMLMLIRAHGSSDRMVRFKGLRTAVQPTT